MVMRGSLLNSNIIQYSFYSKHVQNNGDCYIYISIAITCELIFLFSLVFSYIIHSLDAINIKTNIIYKIFLVYSFSTSYYKNCYINIWIDSIGCISNIYIHSFQCILSENISN